MNRPNDRFGFNPNLMTDLELNAIVLEKADIGRTDLLFMMFALFKDNCFFLFFFFFLFSFPFFSFPFSGFPSLLVPRHDHTDHGRIALQAFFHIVAFEVEVIKESLRLVNDDTAKREPILSVVACKRHYFRA